MFYNESYDVIVIGGGHAGTEAALAAARMGSKTLLLSHNIETLGQMSCNPAIGGIGKGHLVKEIDAMGGIMGKAADKGGIQFRILNRRKGPAVRATRAQADRQLYKQAIRIALENQANLQLFQQSVDDLIVENDQVVGVVTNFAAGIVKNPVPQPTSKTFSPERMPAPFKVLTGSLNRRRNGLSITTAITGVINLNKQRVIGE